MIEVWLSLPARMLRMFTDRSRLSCVSSTGGPPGGRAAALTSSTGAGSRADGPTRRRAGAGGGAVACYSDWLVFVDRLGGAAPRMRVFSRRSSERKR